MFELKALELHSDRLLLRGVELSDLSEVHQLLSIPEVDKYNALGIPTNKEVTSVYLNEWIDNRKMRKELVFALNLLEDDVFIGLISLRIGNAKYSIGSMWYKLHPNFWGKGYATESVKRILKFGFEEIGLHRIEAGCAIGNIGSIRVLEKSGMIKEGHKRKVLPLKSGWSDNYEFAMLDEDWKTLY
ncbi:GNAT family N-acetyltransferase [Aquimarina sp. 2201CG14-23]|uniref:GNAT family N-acetyltransferase n=1 Tax=Aquimarina mycalae TaxID=3040073 RepID=UPI002477DCA3|nr:GNAT family N-acetyltransferase [Aquimarina sp. 2201CG14-23]MDH7443993.1 GNAT family N-acetyltransferase [Aquimarina sp. 2201CG14-23]